MRAFYSIIILSVLSISVSKAQVFVAADATGANNGTSWEDAYTNLQVALDDASNGNEQVWVKSGIYYPTSGIDRTITFVIRNRVELYGGFNGTETLLSQRDFRAHETIISGNIGDPNLTTDNSLNLFIAMGDHPILDGITLSDIYDNSSSNSGAIRLPNSNGFQMATIANCTFKNNEALSRTVGIYATNGTYNIEHCQFYDNDGREIIFILANGTLNVLNNVIANNNAAAINLNAGQAITIANNTIFGNQTGIKSFSVPFNLYNNILWNNTLELDIFGTVTLTNNIIEGTTEPNNFDFDPEFKDSPGGDFSLTTCSAARNLGNNSLLPASMTNDILGNDRIFDTTVDLGAYEVQGFPIQINNIETLDIACFGESSGQIAIGAVGGTGLLEYSADGVSFISNPLLSGLISGSYNVLVRDDGGCVQNVNVNINELAASSLILSASKVDVTGCPGEATGEIVIAATGGVAAYTYSIDGINFQSGNVFSGLSAGVYNATVRDAVDCEKILSVTINEPTPFILNNTVTAISCNGASDGEITVSATGGTGSLEFSIDNGNFGPNTIFSGLAAGTYTITVKDGSGCTHDKQVTVTEPTALASSITKTPVSCSGLSDGSISILASGGTAPYQYSIDNLNFQSSPVFSGLSQETVEVTIVDNAGCLINKTIEINQPDTLIIAASFDGAQANIFTEGGTPPYQYSVDGSSFQSESNFLLPNGQYTFTVRDANDCESSTTQSLVITSLDNGLEDVSIRAYPNPTTSTVTLSGVSGKVDIRLLDETGRVVVDEKQMSSNMEIPVRFLKPGYYLLDVITDKGQHATFRLMKK